MIINTIKMNLEEIIIEIIKEKLISGDEFDKNDYQEIYNRCELYNLLLRNKILKNINKANVQHEILIKNNRDIEENYEFEFIY